MSERMKRIKDFINKDKPKIKQEHFDWSQFEKLHQLIYDEKTDTYKMKKSIEPSVDGYCVDHKKLISEFVDKLRKYLGCETCTSSVKPETCKSCCDLYPIIKEYEAKLK